MNLSKKKNFSSLISHFSFQKGNALSLSKGFTLIELLIVIAVLGVLAAIVLVAINPAEQLARGRDSSRLQQVASLGHAASAYYTAQQALLPTSTTWQTSLKNSGDIKTELTNSPVGSPAVCDPIAYKQNDICYVQSGTTDFLIWAGAESSLYKIKAGNGSSCAAGTAAFFIFDSTLGRAGVRCSFTTAVPVAGGTLY